MSRLIFIVVIGVLHLVACSAEKVESEGASPADPEKAEPVPEIQATAPETAAEGYELTVKGASEDGTQVNIQVQVDAGNNVAGEFTSGSKKLALTGVVQDNTLRCWLAGSDTSDQSVWRGTLAGTIENNKGAGEFTISDDAASTTVSGRWNSI